MALQAKLNLRQSQTLVMTPQLLQSIRLLQFTHAELERFIDGEIERNPLLERGDPEGAGDSEGSPSEQENDGADWDSAAIADRLDASLNNVFPDDPGRHETVGPDLSAQWKSAAGASTSAAAGDGFDLEDVVAARVSLRAHVEEQIAWAFADPAERLIARELADALDEAGYLRCLPHEVAGRLGTGLSEVEAVLGRCHDFDPPGLFARDLAECLSLQLRARDRLDPAMQAMLAHLDLLAKRDFSALTRICSVGEDDLVDMLAEIRALDPRPGTAFSVGSAEPIVADVVVRTAADGGWAVELNGEALPKVLVNETYFAAVTARAANREERQFLSDCAQSANWLTRSLDQRARTILKVATEIVRRQDAFLVEGVRRLRPLNLRTVADAIGMHESTVSRVTANKYMMTPRGVFELRYFFTAAIASADDGGDAHSAEAVRDRIRGLIEAEEAGEVLSDDAIVDILRKSGIDIARRTVAKYREGMSIPSSVQRRREKRVLARIGA
jgi:RNA polymerase sigma-54 factor